MVTTPSGGARLASLNAYSVPSRVTENPQPNIKLSAHVQELDTQNMGIFTNRYAWGSHCWI